jgi:hypothetical protein
MYTRDVRKGFCPEDHWISKAIKVTAQAVSLIKKDIWQTLYTIKKILIEFKLGRKCV